VQGDDGKWNKFGGRLAWDKSAICSNNSQFGGTGARKPTEDYVAAPNIDHSQERVRNDLKQWLKYLRTNVGFDGWRFDFVKGYGECHRAVCFGKGAEVAAHLFHGGHFYTAKVTKDPSTSLRSGVTTMAGA
jgi:glycosidase